MENVMRTVFFIGMLFFVGGIIDAWFLSHSINPIPFIVAGWFELTAIGLKVLF